jgi:uncharacterized protein
MRERDGDLTLQRRFAAHMRAPAVNLLPEFDDARLAVYRRLFFNNVYGLLASNFPVAFKIIGAPKWRTLCRAFYAEYACNNPRFTEFASQFLDFAAARPELFKQPDFLGELLHYEYVETELTLAPDPAKSSARPGSEASNIMLSPLTRLLAYRYPVHQLSEANQPAKAPAQPTFLLVWRDPSDQVRFEALSPGAMRLLLPLADSAVPEIELFEGVSEQSDARVLVDRLLSLGALVISEST